jgi:hypothetical protein
LNLNSEKDKKKFIFQQPIGRLSFFGEIGVLYTPEQGQSGIKIICTKLL